MGYTAASRSLRVWASRRRVFRARRRSFHADLWRDRDPERQRNVGIEPFVDDDFHRHALNDLDEVAGGVLGREVRELGAGAELDAVDMPLEPQLRIGIDADRDMLAGPHVDELALLEVGGDPGFCRDD